MQISSDLLFAYNLSPIIALHHYNHNIHSFILYNDSLALIQLFAFMIIYITRWRGVNEERAEWQTMPRVCG